MLSLNARLSWPSIARQQINEIPGLYCFGEEILGDEATYDYDPTKISIHVRHLGITGYETENWLRDNYNVEIEMSDMYNILCLVTPGDTSDSVSKLLISLRGLSERFHEGAEARELVVKIPDIPQLSLIAARCFLRSDGSRPVQGVCGTNHCGIHLCISAGHPDTAAWRSYHPKKYRLYRRSCPSRIAG